MANYQSLKTAINAVIKANGNKEITGTVLNEVLLAMVNSLGAGYQFAGVATPSTNPGTPDQKVFYIASQAGTYTNFGGAVVSDGIAIFKWNGTWTTETLDLPIPEQVQSDWTETDTTKKSYIKHKPNIPPSANVDPVPTEDSPNAVSSGGTYDMIVHTAATLFGDIQNATDINATLSADGKIYNDYNAGDIFYIEQDDVRKYRVAYAAGTADAEHPVTINGMLFYFADNATDAIWLSLRINTVSTEQQSLSSQQKAQARTNIAAVSYEEQSLEAGQQVQAQNNMMGKAYSSAAADHSGLGKVYVDKNNGVLTQAMMQATNTVYVIQYDYTMNGNIAVPANCVLEFDGGSISGSYTLTGNNTELSGDIRLDVLFGGTFKNENLKATQLINKTASRLSNVIVSMFNIGLGLYVDENITLDGTQKTVSMVKFLGNNKTISQTNSFTVNGNVTLKDVRFNNFPNNEMFLNVNDFTARSYFVEIDNIVFDGSDHCHRFINHLGSNDLSSVSNITVTNSTFKNILEYAIRICAEVKQGYIAYNTFEDIGYLSSQLNASIAIDLGKTYLEKKVAENVIIEDNVISNIKCYYTLVDDSKETHGILLYGNNCVIRNNVIENIYSNQEDGNPGADAEGIYVKGSYNTITGNHLTNACGTGPDGSITLKGLEFTDLAVDRDSNTITGNVIHSRFGNGITSCGTNGIIKNNIIYGEYKATGGIALYAAVGNIVDGNTIVVNNIVKDSSDQIAYNGFMVIGTKTGHNILSNNVCTGKAGLYISSSTTIKDCKFTVEDTRFGVETRYTSFIFSGAACDIVFENNTFNFGSCRATALMEMPANYAVNMMVRKCMFNFYVSSSASVVSSPLYMSLFQNGSVKIIDTVIDISSGVDVRKVFNEATDKYWANSIFTDTSVDINTTKVIGDYQFPA